MGCTPTPHMVTERPIRILLECILVICRSCQLVFTSKVRDILVVSVKNYNLFFKQYLRKSEIYTRFLYLENTMLSFFSSFVNNPNLHFGCTCDISVLRPNNIDSRDPLCRLYCQLCHLRIRQDNPLVQELTY